MINNIFELLSRLYKRAQEGYYKDKPAHQFFKDELTLKYYGGLMDKASYQIKKQILEQLIDDDYYRNNHNLGFFTKNIW